MSTVHGNCHCGAIQFEVTLTDGINTARRCDCSLCSRRGAVAVTANKDDITYISGREKLTLYQFNTKIAKHYFCKVCGVYTHHNRRSNPGEIGINLACLADHTPFLSEVIVNDGQNHPTDTGKNGVAGVLRYDPMETTE